MQRENSSVPNTGMKQKKAVIKTRINVTLQSKKKPYFTSPTLYYGQMILDENFTYSYVKTDERRDAMLSQDSWEIPSFGMRKVWARDLIDFFGWDQDKIDNILDLGLTNTDRLLFFHVTGHEWTRKHSRCLKSALKQLRKD